MRLDKYLADMGRGTRSELKKLIRGGRVMVDGSLVRDPGAAVGEDSRILLDGSPVCYERYEYYMLNKPTGVVSATEDRHQRTVLDLLRETGGDVRRDLFPVGRLDKDTVGLLLISNDGGLAHRLLSPGAHVDKTYYARVRGRVTDREVLAFREGLRVDEELTAMPAELKVIVWASSADGLSEVEITIREGKFHQIKRMFQALGMEVVYLKRLSMGALRLDENLREGEYRKLTENELRALREG